MSTIQCQGCGKRIMQKGEKCPHCGEPIPQDSTIPKSPEGSKYIHKYLEKKTEEEIIPDDSGPILIDCKACGKAISKNAVSCPHCGEPVSSAAKSYDAIEDYVEVAGKSRMTSFLLTLLLGPLGLLYSSVVWGIILIVVAIASSPTVFGPIVVWILSIIMGDSMTVNHNEKLYAQAELMQSK